MLRLWDKIDLHVAAALVLLAPAAYLGWWGLAGLFLVPQGRIVTRALVDHLAYKRPSREYLVANEILVLGFAGVLAGLRLAIPTPA